MNLRGSLCVENDLNGNVKWSAAAWSGFRQHYAPSSEVCHGAELLNFCLEVLSAQQCVHWLLSPVNMATGPSRSSRKVTVPRRNQKMSARQTRWRFLWLNLICVITGRTWGPLCLCGPSAPCFLSALLFVNRKPWLLFSVGLFSSVCPLVASLPLPPSLTVYQKTDSPPPAGCRVSASIQVRFDFEPTATRTTYFFLPLFL